MSETPAETVETCNLTDDAWYSARCIIRFLRIADGSSQHVFEERIVLIKARDFDEAFLRASEVARKYAAENHAEFTEFVDVFHLSDNEIDDGVEVFSLLRQSDLSPEEYISRHFDTGTEFRSPS